MTLARGTPILYQGLVASPASWARVGRGYAKAFLGRGLEVACVSPRGFLHDPEFPLVPGMRLVGTREATKCQHSMLGLGFLHPPQVHRLLGARRVNLFVWESDRVPSQWPKFLADGSDLVAVPSRFAEDALLACGFPRERLVRAAYGHDLGPVQRALRGESHPFTFLAVAAPHWRKGVREMLRAYRSAFRATDSVLFRIKTTYDPRIRNRPRPFEIPSWRTLLDECSLVEPEAPAVEIDERRVPDEAMAEIYASADVYVGASWGEAYGLALLEAMATGMPAIATGWGGHREFFPAGPDCIPYRLEAARDRLYVQANDAQVAIPDVGALAARMRWHFEHRAVSEGLGEANRALVADRTWTRAATELLGVIGAAL